MSDDIKKNTDILMKFAITMLIILGIFVSTTLVMIGEMLDLFMIFMLMISLFVVIIGIIGCLFLLYRYRIEKSGGIISRFIQNQKAFELGQWHKQDLLPVAIFISIFYIVILFGIIILENNYRAALLFLVITVFFIVFLFYGGLRRKGWEFKKIHGHSLEEIVNKVQKIFKENEIEFIETRVNKVLFACSWCKTFSIGATGLSLSIIKSTVTLLGIGKIKKHNKEKAKEIQNLIDLEF